jgi:ABC-2 type transport system ATP-binding protein
MEDFAIKVENIEKTFKLPHEKQSSIKSIFINAFRSKTGYEIQEALKDISFEVKKGEFFGIVGRNGSGKSTLLKLLAGIYTPTNGQVHVRGSLTPFIELGVGFSPELTGRENVYLNGSLLGFSRKDMQIMYKDIVRFAELERFMDQKLKNYSSGMQVRLAFSIAIRAQSDILLLDEVLAVGDEAFQRKCYDYFENLKREKQTVIIVTHDMAAIERFCDKGILIENGKIVTEGAAQTISKAYSDLFKIEKEKVPAGIAPEEDFTAKRFGDQRFKISDIQAKLIKSDINLYIGISCQVPIKKRAYISFTLKSEDNNSLLGKRIAAEFMKKMNKGDKAQILISIPNIFDRGSYKIDASIYIPSEDSYSDFWPDCAEFKIINKGLPTPSNKIEWEIS